MGGIYLTEGRVPFEGVYWSTWLELFGASLCNFFAQNIMTIGNQCNNPATIGLITYLSVLYNYIVDVSLFDESFTPVQYAGMILCIGSSFTAAIVKICLEHWND